MWKVSASEFRREKGKKVNLQNKGSRWRDHCWFGPDRRQPSTAGLSIGAGVTVQGWECRHPAAGPCPSPLVPQGPAAMGTFAACRNSMGEIFFFQLLLFKVCFRNLLWLLSWKLSGFKSSKQSRHFLPWIPHSFYLFGQNNASTGRAYADTNTVGRLDWLQPHLLLGAGQITLHDVCNSSMTQKCSLPCYLPALAGHLRGAAQPHKQPQSKPLHLGYILPSPAS